MKLNAEDFSEMEKGINRPRPYNKIRMPRTQGACAVCGESANGVYFGAMVCLPCKSFFIRCTKDGPPSFQCTAKAACDIQSNNRMRCQACRFSKCLVVGMARREKPETVEPGEGQELCRVCSDIANGLHFGVMTCEGCKKFFRRALKEYDTYVCKHGGQCQLNPRSRNACRYCRHQKCIRMGMSREAIRMGRPKKTKRRLPGFGEIRPLHIRQCLREGQAYSSVGCRRMGSMVAQDGSYSVPGSFPSRWDSSYMRMIGHTMPMSQPRCVTTDSWPSPPVCCAEVGYHSPVSPLSAVSSSSSCSSSGQSSPNQSLYPPPEVKSEPMDTWPGCCQMRSGGGGGYHSPPYGYKPTTKPVELPGVSTIINSDVVDSLIQLASAPPRQQQTSANPRLSDQLGLHYGVEDEAIDSLLKVLEDFEKGDPAHDSARDSPAVDETVHDRYSQPLMVH